MSKTRRRFTRILLFTVSGLGLLSALLLLTDPPPPDFDSGSGLFALNSSVLASQRGLASVAPNEKQPSPDTLMQFDCTEKPSTLKTFSARFRIKGPLCAENGDDIITAEVQNTSNGYVATVFHQAGQFTTDYINLNDGKNVITLKFSGETGMVKKTIIVLRTSTDPTSKM